MLKVIWNVIKAAAIAAAIFFAAATAWWELTTSPWGVPPGW
jgi:hypothetical protein